MIAILDTHTLLWSFFSQANLSRQAAALILDPANELLVSAASAFEIATKVRIGKLPQAAPLEADFLGYLGKAGFLLRNISVADGLRAGRLSGAHKDPFDRILAAQALADDVPIISNDSKLDLFGVRRIW